MLAALLADSEDPDLDAVSEDYPLEQDFGDAAMTPSVGQQEDEEEEEETFESVAAIRDLDGAAALEVPSSDSEDGGEEATDVQLPYDAYRVTKAEDLLGEPVESFDASKVQKEGVQKEDRTKVARSKAKKRPVVKATKSANAAKGAALKAAGKKRSAPKKQESKTASKTVSKAETTKAVTGKGKAAAEKGKGSQAKEAKPEAKPQKPRAVKRPIDKVSGKASVTRKKKSS
jgi:hypothetical protein